MKRVLLALLLMALFCAGVLATVAYRVDRFMNSSVSVPEAGLPFEIVPGSPFAAVSHQLVTRKVIGDDLWFQLYARWSNQAGAIQAGDYLIEAGSTPKSLLQQFTSGAVRMYTFTLVEGWNYREVLQALHANEAVRPTMTDEDWPALLDQLGAASHPEGLFLPETYRFARHTTDKELLRQAFVLMQRTLADEWAARGDNAPVGTPYEAVILASIVEKETARADERPKISGVFARRLKKGMRLQTDPTVIYGIGSSFDGNLTRVHLKTDTAYNTYTRHGLPPTPIAMPGRAAINAALHPAPGDELYFVATGIGDGSHQFSVTKAEHDAAVAEYLQRLRQQRRQPGSGQGVR